MNVTLIQTALSWRDPEKNLRNLSEKLNRIEQKTDLIILPEMFSTGFTMTPEVDAQSAGGTWLSWMQEMAAKKNAVVTGSLSVEERGKYYNRLYWVDPAVAPKNYDKRHLFRMGSEHEHYCAGKEKLIADLGAWRVCPLVCYDLRFPVWSRNYAPDPAGRYAYDLLIYVANWPAVRSHAWVQLLIARAIENQCYVVGVNRVGDDGNGVGHSGDSMVVGPKGEILYAAEPNREMSATVNLSIDTLKSYREKFPAALDADNFSIESDI